MKKTKIIIVILIILAVAVLIISKTNNTNILFSPSTKVNFNGEQIKTSQAVNSVKIQMIELESQNAGKIYPSEDYTPLYDFLQENTNDLTAILLICDNFDPLFCLKKASEQNPELRNEICEELITRIKTDYSEVLDERRLVEFVENHKKDCEKGVPQFLY